MPVLLLQIGFDNNEGEFDTSLINKFAYTKTSLTITISFCQ